MNTQRRADWRWTNRHGTLTAIGISLIGPIPPRTGCYVPLDDGITLLDVDGSCGVAILQSLVLNHLLLHDGPAFWVDANGHATATRLAQITVVEANSTGFDFIDEADTR